MDLRELLLDVNEETKTVVSPTFQLLIGNAAVLPSVGDGDVTFENFDDRTKRVKIVETCVLFVDLRQSTQLSMVYDPVTLSKLYSCFVRGVIRCAEFYTGKVRNIAGDRVMILFDPKDCFKNAVNTAILINTFSSFVLKRHFKNAFAGCGIGIDYGKMLATKVGTIKRGTETVSDEAKSLVWLGMPANVASKLADIASKSFSRAKVAVGYQDPLTNQLYWKDKELDEFFAGLEMTYSFPTIARFKEWNVFSFFKTISSYSYSPILMTKKVLEGFKSACPLDPSIGGNWWRPKQVSVSGYNGVAYEGAVYFKFGEELK